MAIQQVGAASAQSEVPVYYVPPPQQPFNIAAAYVSSFLKYRTPVAEKLFWERIKAMNPNERIEQLLEAADIERAQRQAEINMRRDVIREEGSNFRALLNFFQGMEKIAGDIRQTAAQEQTKRQAQFSLTTEAELKTQKALERDAKDLAEQVATGNIEGAKKGAKAAAGRIENAIVEGEQKKVTLTNGFIEDVRRAIRTDKRIPDADKERVTQEVLGASMLQEAPIFKKPVGISGPGDPSASVQKAIEMSRAAPMDGRFGYGVRGMPAAAPAEPGAAPAAIGTQEVVPGALPAMPAMPAQTGQQRLMDTVREMQGRRPDIKGIGDPIYTKTDPRVRQFEFANRRGGFPFEERLDTAPGEILYTTLPRTGFPTKDKRRSMAFQELFFDLLKEKNRGEMGALAEPVGPREFFSEVEGIEFGESEAQARPLTPEEQKEQEEQELLQEIRFGKPDDLDVYLDTGDGQADLAPEDIAAATEADMKRKKKKKKR